MQSEDSPRLIPVHEIEPECNDRRIAEDGTGAGDIEGLAASIIRHGLIQPITVRPKPDGTGFFLIAAGGHTSPPASPRSGPSSSTRTIGTPRPSC